jgi:hypothetical protein
VVAFAYCVSLSVVHFAFVMYLFPLSPSFFCFILQSSPTYVVSTYVFPYLHHLPQTQYNSRSSQIRAHDAEDASLPVVLNIGDDDDDNADDPPAVQDEFRVDESKMNIQYLWNDTGKGIRSFWRKPCRNASFFPPQVPYGLV